MDFQKKLKEADEQMYQFKMVRKTNASQETSPHSD